MEDAKSRGWDEQGLADLAAAVRAGDRASLARAITLVESRRSDHLAAAQSLLTRLLPETGKAHRIGITGVPGVGKSTFIDAFGSNLTAMGKKLAVLAVDPSSGRSGGSILGDKTRMEKLAVDPCAFIRPSPSSGVLGGVARATRETILLCEAAGYDVVLVETVGAGQSEYVVADMVDLFLVLMLPGAGDMLQGIKKGVLELADIIAVNKADQAPDQGRRAARDYASALQIMTAADVPWKPPVLSISGLLNQGLDDLWARMQQHHKIMIKSGLFHERRQEQTIKWMWAMVEDRLLSRFRANPEVKAALPDLMAAVKDDRITATLAAEKLLAHFGMGDFI
ncbi:MULTISPECIES: methylmalonyl Co-A mutase-associated GTPase MeaB [unclassified Iodidimonas]|uniref:methylmalonyl Co-A mutase-associated GTPase MeaB n=1 Tax=unclassified Iodidimonas TaxID=2626145 RepID=UPI002482D94E|nr:MULTISPECIES: methylmalonyl Co-A mutase-associated GTPase MeaB [unclassified Iodidimonas]